MEKGDVAAKDPDKKTKGENMNINMNAIKDIAIITAVLWLVRTNAPSGYVLIAATGVGFVVLLLGFIRVHKHFKLEGPLNKENIKSTITRIVIAVVLACVSILFWDILFDLKRFYVLPIDTSGVVSLWTAITMVYTYLLLTSSEKSIQSEAAVQRNYDNR